MRRPSVIPTGQERRFGEEEVIVSKTDTKGVLTYTNDVFQRVSAYREDELLGRPHSIIRHPDMPGGVFKLLWDTVAAGEEIFAFVNNLAADGCHYWVLAHVTPSFGADGAVVGYHSNRRVPARAAIAQVEPLYRRMRAEEHSHRRTVDAAAASAAMLQELLTERGQTYEELVWQIIDGQKVGV